MIMMIRIVVIMLIMSKNFSLMLIAEYKIDRHGIIKSNRKNADLINDMSQI